MDSRRSSKRSLSPDFPDGRLLTKKEIENNPQYRTPPLLPNKHLQNCTEALKKKVHDTGDGSAQPIFFTKQTKLSTLYNAGVKQTYLAQCFMACQCIGEGSFGVVYKARKIDDGRRYAVKATKKNCGSVGRCAYSEVRHLEKIGEHINIIKFYQAWEENSILYIQMELCSVSLGTYTKSYHELPIEQLWDIFIDMLHALKHLHDRSLVHLDIKPDNIMISSDAKYKLGDFGLLRDLTEQPVGANDKEQSEGDAKYLAKEVFDGIFGPAADVFSLGISMLELSSDLILPVHGPLWHVLRDGLFPDKYFKLIPPKLRTVIIKMMEPNYNRRISVNGVLELRNVTKAIEERANAPRMDYFALWKATSDSENDVRSIAVCVNATERNLANVNNGNNSAHPNTSACITPPKRVSQVILYSI